MVLPMMNLEVALQGSQYQPFQTARDDRQDSLPKSTWEVMLNDASEPLLCETAVGGKEKAPSDHKSHWKEKRHTNVKDVIAQEVEPAVTELIPIELSTMVKESLDEILRTCFYNAKSRNRSLVHNIFGALCWTC